MASATNSRVPKSVVSLADAARAARERVTFAPVPLLAFSIPDFARCAWREGHRSARRLERRTVSSFRQAAHRALRGGDVVAHDAGSERFVVLMTAPSRASRATSATDCRSALERIARRLEEETQLPVERGWDVLRDCDDERALAAHINAALERGVREKERYDFFAVVGHELRTPLAAVRGYLETLLDDDALCETVRRRFLQTARAEAARMGRLLDGMFEFSLLDLSAHALRRSECDLQEALESAADAVAPFAAQRNVRVDVVVASALVAIDRDACVQLCLNLLENAVKYGREIVSVCVERDERSADLLLCVDDDGPGVAPEERHSIFTLRSRGASAAGRPGTGIGLAIVKMIVERAGGSVNVYDAPQGGARFCALLPRARADFCAQPS